MTHLHQGLRRHAARAALFAGLLFVALTLTPGTETANSLCAHNSPGSSNEANRCPGTANADHRSSSVFAARLAQIGLTAWPDLELRSLTIAVALLGVGATSAVVVKPAGWESSIVGDAFALGHGAAALTSDDLELLIKIDKVTDGYVVNMVCPLGITHSVEHNRALPTDRGSEALFSLSAESSQAQAVRTFGTELFHAIFAGGSEPALQQSIDLARTNNRALRITLQIDEAFADLPWEYLFNPERGAFLTCSHDTSFVRLLSTTDATRSQEPIETLRILSMAASPHMTDPLDIATEQQDIRDALAQSIAAGQVTLDFVDGGTFADLAAALHTVKPHVFHFAGHGKWNTKLDNGAILFEDDRGFSQHRTGIELGALLNRPGLRLAIFNSCDAAISSKHDRFAGVTSSLVAQGVPAAVGMQFRVDDKAAVAFSVALLRDVADEVPIDQAVTTARLDVFAKLRSIDWATPVLTTRVPVDEILPRT